MTKYSFYSKLIFWTYGYQNILIWVLTIIFIMYYTIFN